ncbi:MAG: preprotein translocase subunit SecA [Megasphaera elsdenii]|uniref:Protein translocase subunit SecA n=4 Tax=Megasphaera elsdenii TaxID=907 RepID=G0VLU8_MEGEL|nr:MULTISPECIES: preprotein translocase subunit SecA [Megasphaera]ALG42281.1 preprotein translocase subunit SecA [Megasphaera elsdenii 14-14]AVO27744.1 preprotein translocase subunit SecA [Megasphaera elsdenii]AVO75015.1 preprotein translocase subunit SecA [Megasphaera elsdenii DSM 20460]KGI89199.1 preprotein translocase subunit SecA [Megasphaera elsdenii]MDD6862214.1 preprotein translocase subunit SecA [Megasphaera elsdenii]
MFNKLIQRLLGNNTEHELKKMWPIVRRINDLEPKLAGLSDASLQEKTFEFKNRLANGETLDDILPEAFAVVREASRRVTGMRHFDVQLLGGIVLHRGDIAEMRTGEGKTLVATLPVYLNALTGKGVHVVTVNDYLATRDSEDMGRIYKFLGLSVGLIVHDLTYDQRRRAYNADVTYGTNNEFGFDYLRDNMVISEDQMVQRPLNYCIVDEVDSILIDEARTPLIISGPGEKSTDLYYTLAGIVKTFTKDDYTMDEKQKTIAPTDSGVAKVEKMLGISNMFDNEHLDLNHLVIQALRARFMMHRDKDYVVKNGEIVIVDEFTGRLMFGRRYSDGLHQSIEAKENVKVQGESKTLATITFQNYFRMYEKLAGMTGTAKTEEDEFNKIYKLDVYVIPTNKPAIRKDLPDVIYKTKNAKYRAVVREVKKRHATGQPILVGTTSINQSEILSQLLDKENIVHNVLNAKYHEKEAEIIKNAGQKGMVTIATNMAGRGTDIKLGPGVAELGGLMIIGTERHESRRIDNQLRGRAGRQGDPGTTQFFLSLEDDLMRIFGSDNISKFMDKLGMDEDEPITAKMITRSIEKAQKKVESHNFEIRKYVLEYDDVMNQQREVLYGQRRQVLTADSLRDTIMGMVDDIIHDGLDKYADEKLYPEEWDFAGLLAQMQQYFVPKNATTVEELENLSRVEVQDKLKQIAVDLYDERLKEIGETTMKELEKAIMLRVVDSKWMDHLDAMDALKEGINLRAYGQKNPLVEYKFEAYEMFEEMIDSIKRTVVTFLYHIQVTYSKPVPQAEDHLQGAHEVHEESKPVSAEDIKRDEEREKQ